MALLPRWCEADRRMPRRRGTSPRPSPSATTSPSRGLACLFDRHVTIAEYAASQSLRTPSTSGLDRADRVGDEHRPDAVAARLAGSGIWGGTCAQSSLQTCPAPGRDHERSGFERVYARRSVGADAVIPPWCTVCAGMKTTSSSRTASATCSNGVSPPVTCSALRSTYGLSPDAVVVRTRRLRRVAPC